MLLENFTALRGVQVEGFRKNRAGARQSREVKISPCGGPPKATIS
jgi:hypothetical protein